jgi:hypothetical protein
MLTMRAVAELPGERLAQQKRGPEVDLVGLVDEVGGEVGQRTLADDRGIVDEDVDHSGQLARLLEHLVGRIRVPEVGHDNVASRQFPGRVFEAGLVAVDQHRPRTGGREPAGDGQPDSAGRTCDQRCAADEGKQIIGRTRH